MRIIDSIIGFIAPHRCLNCSKEGALLCLWCWPAAVSAIPPRCVRCHRLSSDYETCKNCRRYLPIRRVWVASEYVDIPKQLIAKLKFGRAAAAADTIAGLMADALPHLEDVVLAHVPTATSRRRQRGYDHAELITKALARRLDLPRLTLLARRGQSRQVGASRQQRLRQLEGMFYAIRPRQVSGRTVLLIDDITTTGATLSQAAKTLRAAGIKQINAAVFAQKA